MEPPTSSTTSSQTSAPLPTEQPPQPQQPPPPPQSQPLQPHSQQLQPQSQQQQQQTQHSQSQQQQQQQAQSQQQQPQYQQQQQQQQQQQAESHQQPPQQSQLQPQTPPPQQQPTSVSSIQNPNPNPNPNPTNSQSFYPQQQQLNIIGGPPPYNGPWSQPPSQFSHFPSQFHSSSTTTGATTSSLPQRGGIAIGVPAASQSAASFAPQYPSSVSSSSPSPARPPIHGMPGMGMIGSQVRPGGVPPSALHQQRPVQAASGIRPQALPNSLPSAPQGFQGHGVMRSASVTPPSTSTPSTSQSQLSPNQPWLRPPLPSQSYRPQANPQSLQQRSHIPQQSPQIVQAAPLPPNQLLPSPQQQQNIPASNQSQENYGHQVPSSRVSQPLLNQQHSVKVQGSANLRPPSPVIGQASVVQSGQTDNTTATEISEPCSTILSKRSIQELVNQIDPYEKLDPEVEDVLVDIAEDFIDSVTTFGCSLAKHRKSNTLEAKDILLHLDRTWHMTLPGFNGDEIKAYKKPVINDIHKERLSLIKRSLTGAEGKTSSGPATGNVKGHLVKTTPNVVGS